jgi:hypothetical protein
MRRGGIARKLAAPAVMEAVFAPAQLAQIYEPEVSLLWWARPPPAEASALLDEAPFSWAREVGHDGTGLATLERHIGSGSVFAEVREIVELHAELFGAEQLGVRVALTDQPMCPGFHVDRVHCRLIAALAGAGTQWRREPVSSGPDAGEVHQLPTGAIGLFKGTAWEGSRAAVHRSPPGSLRRLVMTVDLL